MSRRIAVVAILVLGGMLPGCISVPKATATDTVTSSWSGKSVVLTERPRAAFVAMTAGKAAFALVGAVAAIDAGKRLVTENDIEDPAPRVARELLAIAHTQYGVVPANSPAAKVDTTDVKQLAHAGSGADLVIDVQSLGEAFNYFSTDWSHYWVSSGLIVRVVDVRTGEVLAGGSCRRNSHNEPNPPSKDELLANQAERLKSILSAQRDACRDELAKSLLHMQPTKT